MIDVDAVVDHAKFDALAAGWLGGLPTGDRPGGLVFVILEGLGLEVLVDVDGQAGEAAGQGLARLQCRCSGRNPNAIEIHRQLAQAHPFDNGETHLAGAALKG